MLTKDDKEQILDEIFSDIVRKAKPEDVFDESELKEWAKAREVDEIFDDDELEHWAIKNGFVKEK